MTYSLICYRLATILSLLDRGTLVGALNQIDCRETISLVVVAFA